MAKKKTEFDPTCFGTINKDKKSSCNNCAYSEECETFKEPFAEKKLAAGEKALNSYFTSKAAARSTAISKILAYGIAVAILIFVFWRIGNDI